MAAWLTSLDLPFPVHVHWLPVNASWLDQTEIVFSELQRKALTPNDFESTDHVRQRIVGFCAERNRRAQPIQWTSTRQQSARQGPAPPKADGDRLKPGANS